MTTDALDRDILYLLIIKCINDAITTTHVQVMWTPRYCMSNIVVRMAPANEPSVEKNSTFPVIEESCCFPDYDRFFAGMPGLKLKSGIEPNWKQKIILEEEEESRKMLKACTGKKGI